MCARVYSSVRACMYICVSQSPNSDDWTSYSASVRIRMSPGCAKHEHGVVIYPLHPCLFSQYEIHRWTDQLSIVLIAIQLALRKSLLR